MKQHRILGLLLAGTLASAGAHAQDSSVSIYGFVNAAVGKAAGSNDKGLLDSAGSRLGFTGQEDLGGGLKASFLLEHRLSPQTGSSSGGDKFWLGGSYVALGGDFGKVILGRWWTQAFLKSQYASDPFGMQTVGLTYGTVGCGVGCVGAFWVDKSVSYEFSSGPFAFGVQVAETGAGGERPINAGLSYGSGPLYIGYGYENPGNTSDVWHHATINYDFGPAKLITGFGTGTNAANQDVRNLVVGFTAPVGKGTVIGSYNKHEVNGTTVSSKPSLGYQYAFSKRTKIYATLTHDSKAATSKTGGDLGILQAF